MNRSLQEWFQFYLERDAAPLAYYFARRKHVAGAYAVPEWLVLYYTKGGK